MAPWLQEHRYIIYIHLLAPNAPVGMLELLSFGLPGLREKTQLEVDNRFTR
jgi:hypothetical protein